MKIAMISDIHLNEWRYASPEPLLRLKLQEAALDLFALNMDHYPPDMIVFCGDLFHKKGIYSAAEMEVASSFFSKLSDLDIPIHVLVGNHDYKSETTSLHGLHFLHSYPNVHVWGIGSLAVIEDGFAFFSFTRDFEVLKERVKITVESGAKIGFFHQGVKNVELKNGFILPDEALIPEITDQFEKVFTGHYHDHKIRRNVCIIGAPMQHNWGDEGSNRGYITYDTDTKEIVFIPLYHPEFITLDYKGSDDFTLHTPPIKSILRAINYTGNHSDLIDQLNKQNAVNIEIVPNFAEGISKLQDSKSLLAFDVNAIIKDYVFSQPEAIKEAGLDLLDRVDLE